MTRLQIEKEANGDVKKLHKLCCLKPDPKRRTWRAVVVALALVLLGVLAARGAVTRIEWFGVPDTRVDIVRAASGSFTDVSNALINLAPSGTLYIPGGTTNWAGNLAITQTVNLAYPGGNLATNGGYIYWTGTNIGPPVIAPTNAGIVVTAYGAAGDAIQTTATTTSNSTTITASGFTSADAGKVALVFGAGPVTSGTNRQDLITTVSSVSGDSVVLATAPTITATCPVTIGTDNRIAFQMAIDAATGTNAVVSIPAGTYLLMPTQMVSTATMSSYADYWPAIQLYKGGITLRGASNSASVLLGNSAWALKGSHAARGGLFQQNAVTNNYPIVFDSLVMDGGLGNSSAHGFPASTNDGTGWDVTHGAYLVAGTSGVMPTNTAWTNCIVRNWRGEALRSVTALAGGTNTIVGCTFSNNNASALNLSFPYNAISNRFDNSHFAMEFYHGYAKSPSLFAWNTITNVTGAEAIALCGALTNQVNYGITLAYNTFYQDSDGYICIGSAASQNTTIVSNTVTSTFGRVGTFFSVPSAGYQGTTINSNITIAYNNVTSNSYVIQIDGTAGNRSDGIYAYGNNATGAYAFAYDTGAFTNAFASNNTSLAIRSTYGTPSTGAWHVDTNNTFGWWQSTAAASNATNNMSYLLSARWATYRPSAYTNVLFVLGTNAAKYIPNGTYCMVTNVNNAGYTNMIVDGNNWTTTNYLPSSTSFTYQWTGSNWNKL